jgi:hypothetical protein
MSCDYLSIQGITVFKRIITFCVVAASFGFAAAEENRNTFDQLAYQALDAMWGNAIGPDGNLLQPKTEKERATIPIEPGYVEYVIRSASIAGEAMWCGLDWQPHYLRFMQTERKRNELTTVQAAYIGFLFGLTQQVYSKALSAQETCSEQDRKVTLKKLDQLGRG